MAQFFRSPGRPGISTRAHTHCCTSLHVAARRCTPQHAAAHRTPPRATCSHRFGARRAPSGRTSVEAQEPSSALPASPSAASATAPASDSSSRAQRSALIAVPVIAFRLITSVSVTNFTVEGERRLQATGGVRLQRQAKAGGKCHRHSISVSCLRGCRALPPHFPRFSRFSFLPIGSAMAKRPSIAVLAVDIERALCTIPFKMCFWVSIFTRHIDVVHGPSGFANVLAESRFYTSRVCEKFEWTLCTIIRVETRQKWR